LRRRSGQQGPQLHPGRCDDEEGQERRALATRATAALWPASCERPARHIPVKAPPEAASCGDGPFRIPGRTLARPGGRGRPGPSPASLRCSCAKPDAFPGARGDRGADEGPRGVPGGRGGAAGPSRRSAGGTPYTADRGPVSHPPAHESTKKPRGEGDSLRRGADYGAGRRLMIPPTRMDNSTAAAGRAVGHGADSRRGGSSHAGAREEAPAGAWGRRSGVPSARGPAGAPALTHLPRLIRPSAWPGGG
jgi:hypothetical protein